MSSLCITNNIFYDVFHADERVTHLLAAAARGNESRRRLLDLLDNGVDANSQDLKYETALIKAAGGGHVDICNLLLDRGARINMANSDGWTALHYAADKSYHGVVRALAERGADLNVKTKRGGDTAAHLAAMKGHLCVVRELADSAGDFTIENASGRTVVKQARLYGERKVEEFIVARAQRLSEVGELICKVLCIC